jgi:hypothetical protein
MNGTAFPAKYFWPDWNLGITAFSEKAFIWVHSFCPRGIQKVRLAFSDNPAVNCPILKPPASPPHDTSALQFFGFSNGVSNSTHSAHIQSILGHSAFTNNDCHLTRSGISVNIL